MSSANPQTSTLATRWRRLFAAIFDVLLTMGVAFLAMWPLGTFEHESAYEPIQIVMRIFGLLLGSYLIVNGWTLIKHGQTVGKKLMRIQIVGHSDGQPVPLWKLLIRAFLPIAIMAYPALGLPPFFSVVILAAIGLFDGAFIFSKSRRCLHDYVVGSKVQSVKN